MRLQAAARLVILFAVIAANLPVAMASLFLALAFPGFVWRYLRRRG